MKCEAIAVRTGRPCRNDAVGDTGACEHEAHQLQVRERRERTAPAAPAELSEQEIAPTWDSLESQQRRAAPATNQQQAPDPDVTNQRAGANDRSAPITDPDLAAILAELPTAADSTADEIAETAAGPVVRDRDEFERHARKVLHDGDELLSDDELGPADVDQAAAAREEQDSARIQLRRDVTGMAGGQWRPERVQFYLRVLINPKFVKDGKEPLSGEELEEGGEIGARIMNDLFGERPENPYLAMGAWSAAIVVTRYPEELFSWFGDVARRVRGRPRLERTAEPEPAAAAPPAEPGGVHVDRSFGVRH